MDKITPHHRSSENIDVIAAYIRNFPPEVSDRMRLIRASVHELVNGVGEKISYQMPSFVYRKTYLVHFAGYEQHIGFYPTPSAISAFQHEIACYKHAKGSVQFPLNQPLPLELIRRMIIFRQQEIDMKVI
ncbi:MAG: DUF1801 domain-containing protein [Eubacteriales bacterium]|nr:DUF1801 domain-containing protein [Eubacteriales bacterium]